MYQLNEETTTRFEKRTAASGMAATLSGALYGIPTAERQIPYADFQALTWELTQAIPSQETLQLLNQLKADPNFFLEFCDYYLKTSIIKIHDLVNFFTKIPHFMDNFAQRSNNLLTGFDQQKTFFHPQLRELILLLLERSAVRSKIAAENQANFNLTVLARQLATLLTQPANPQEAEMQIFKFLLNYPGLEKRLIIQSDFLFNLTAELASLLDEEQLNKCTLLMMTIYTRLIMANINQPMGVVRAFTAA